ncbi:MAG TPA: HD domain-containing protein [Methanocorpusculum sp.]|nr:HD domain-containing protein [Methanocorpusculum sp.]HJK57907.1 HD domain-containing protein [Methanocorpusculum sp.]HJK59925.1 HD domain-containing protein [Methanocorpusculum sp.]HJK60738.1 HD domain-containing protein [Methanocorpusculum sp.]HJK65442.1 HD domain-containing protein [Methanocorpusculum sp.]
MPKQIKDPVHGYIEVPTEILPLVDSPALQRLHHIRQLGFAYLVYPGANHTRFEHSLGAMHLASLLCRHLGFGTAETRTICCAALLHDIGHGPYSHASERLMQEYTQFSHDDIREQLKEPILAKQFEKNSISPDEVAALISGSHRYAGIIHGDLDVDRMDYLLRDAHYTGAPYGNFDAERLTKSLAVVDNTIVLNDSGISAAESLLIARTLMGPSVYYHHACRIAEEMFLLACRSHFRKDVDAVREFLTMDDVTATALLLNSDEEITRDLINRIRTRNLYKRAVYAGKELVDRDHLPQTKSGIERLHTAIAETAGVAPDKIILDIPPLRKEMKMDIKVRNHHDLVPFEEIVPMIAMMNATRQGQWRLGVYAPAELRERVSDAAREVLALRRATKQHKLTGII